MQPIIEKTDTAVNETTWSQDAIRFEDHTGGNDREAEKSYRSKKTAYTLNTSRQANS